MIHSYNRLAVPLAIAMAGGMFLAIGWPNAGAFAWVCLLLSVSAMALGILKRQQLRHAPLIVFFFLGYLLVHPWAQHHASPDHISHFCRSMPWQITGTVESATSGPGNRTRFVLAEITLADSGDIHAVAGCLRGVAFGREVPFRAGDRIRFSSRLKPIRNFENPGCFDYRQYQALKGVFASTYITADAINVVSAGPSTGFFSGISRFRSEIIRKINSAASPESAGLLRALLVGDRSGITPVARDRFSRSGVGHLLAISGLHVGTVATAAFWLMTHFFRWIPALLTRAWTRKAAALGTFFPVVGYGLLAGGSPSTQRAVIMVILFLVTLWIDKERDLPGFIAVAAIGIFIIDPPAVFTLSFQLSFAAVITIVLGLRRWFPEKSAEQRLARRLVFRTGQFLAVSILAVAGTLPVAMGAFNEISLIGPLVNCIAVPLVGFGVLPLGLISVCLAEVLPTVAIWGFTGCGEIIGWLVKLLDWTSQMPLAAVVVPALTPIEVWIYYGVLSTLLLRFSRIWRRRFLVALVAVFVLDAAYWTHERFLHRDLRVTILDVGQGSASLIEFPGGHVMLVDGGGLSSNRFFDIGARVVAPVLRRKKILAVDTMVLSHPNADHLNGLYAIVDRFRVGRLWSNGEQADTAGFARFQDRVRERGIEAVEVHRDTLPEPIGGVQVSILNPSADFIKYTPGGDRSDLDNHSLVLRVDFGRLSILFPGDIRKVVEEELARVLTGEQLDCDILVVPHHGSRSSSAEKFIDVTTPKVAIVSAGWQNRFGFPHPDVLDRYDRRECRIFRTDTDGAVRIWINNDRARIRTWSSSRWMELAPAGEKQLGYDRDFLKNRI